MMMRAEEKEFLEDLLLCGETLASVLWGGLLLFSFFFFFFLVFLLFVRRQRCKLSR